MKRSHLPHRQHIFCSKLAGWKPPDSGHLGSFSFIGSGFKHCLKELQPKSQKSTQNKFVLQGHCTLIICPKLADICLDAVTRRRPFETNTLVHLTSRLYHHQPNQGFFSQGFEVLTPAEPTQTLSDHI